jgi:hypothetical protein
VLRARRALQRESALNDELSTGEAPSIRNE